MEHFNELLDIVCTITRLKPQVVIRGAGIRDIADARRMLIALLRREGMSASEIGRKIKRNHATVLYHMAAHEALMFSDNTYRDNYRIAEATANAYTEMYGHR